VLFPKTEDMSQLAAPPGPPGHLLTGSLPEFRGDRLAFFTRLAREYGDVAAFRLAWRRVLLLSHPDLIESVLATNSRNSIKHFALRLNRLLLGNGLVTSEGEFWLRQRRLSQPAFARDRLAGYGEIMVVCARRRLTTWKAGETRDLHAEMMQLTLEIVGQALFGADVAGEARTVGQALEVALECYIARLKSLFLFPVWLPTRRNRRLREAVGRLDAILFRIIQQRRDRSADDGAGGQDDLLSRLLHAQDEDGSRMTDQQLRDEAMTLFLAGHETTALNLAWTWYLLAQHADVEARLHAELRAVLGGRAPTFADLPRLVYTERIVHESLRLYPPVYAVGREAVHDCTIGGYPVSAGTTLLLSQWVVHRDPRFFPDPEVFDPDRWAGERLMGLPKYAYFPFGGGPRVCIGNTFAVTEAILVLATIGQQFRFRLVPGQAIRPMAHLTLRPEHGIRMTLHDVE
jgi:cytochrome P450